MVSLHSMVNIQKKANRYQSTTNSIFHRKSKNRRRNLRIPSQLEEENVNILNIKKKNIKESENFKTFAPDEESNNSLEKEKIENKQSQEISETKEKIIRKIIG